jgi:hypothetical protein
VEDSLQMASMTRIDENCFVSMDHIGIAIVLIGVLPEIGIEVFLELHKIDLLFILSINDQKGSCQIKS